MSDRFSAAVWEGVAELDGSRESSVLGGNRKPRLPGDSGGRAALRIGDSPQWPLPALPHPHPPGEF